MIRLIAYMTTPVGLSGAPRRLLALATVLKGQGIIVCIASQSDSELLQTAEGEGYEAAPVDTPGVLDLRQGALFGGGPWFRLRVVVDLLRQNLRLLRCIRQRGGDAVWIRASKGIAFGALGVVLSGRPLIWDVDYELPSRGVVRWLHRLGLKLASTVVFQHFAAPDAIFGQALAARYRHKFRTIIPGIDLPELAAFRAMRERRNRSEDDPFVILQVGTICDRKNQMVLVKGIIRLFEIRPDKAIRVWLAGGVLDETYEEALRKEIDAHGLQEVVEFLGWRSDIHQLMVNANLLAMPSKDEGVPNAVQEAMAIGLPVAVSEGGGMPEVVTDRDTGWILSMNNAEEWADRIQWCLRYPKECEEVGQRGSTYAFKHFGTQRWGIEYSRVVNEVAGRRFRTRSDDDVSDA